MYTSQGQAFQRWRAEIFCNQAGLSVKLLDGSLSDDNDAPFMSNATRSQKKKDTQVFQLMLQEKLLDVMGYFGRLDTRYSCGDTEGEVRLRWRGDMIRATGELLEMMMDMNSPIETTQHRFKDGAQENLGVRLNSGGRA